MFFLSHMKNSPTWDNLSTVEDVQQESSGNANMNHVEHEFFRCVFQVPAHSGDAQAEIKDQADLEQTGAENHKNQKG